MKDVVIIGAGKIGAVIADLLAQSGDYRVTVADRDEAALQKLDSQADIARVRVNIDDNEDLLALLGGKYAVLSAAPYHLTTKIAEAASAAKVNYLDLTEDVCSTRRVKELAQSSNVAFIPQCGLAPGFISIVAHDLAQRFDTIDNLRLRVGALPQFPSNALGYNLTWSVDGLINECCEPCEALVDGEIRQVVPMEGLEQFSLDGVAYEAFNTSGGLGSMCETYAGRARELNYRSIRYPGHQALMKALLQDLKLRDRRHILKDILEHAIPATLQDVVVVFVTATGSRNGRLQQETYTNKIYSGSINGVMRSAIQITTAAGICAALDLLASGRLPQSGFIRQEDIPLKEFLLNRFGSAYAKSEPVPY